jgi:hypothetical protein
MADPSTRIPEKQDPTETGKDPVKRATPAPAVPGAPHAGRTGAGGVRAERPSPSSAPQTGRGAKAPKANDGQEDELPQPARDSTA